MPKYSLLFLSFIFSCSAIRALEFIRLEQSDSYWVSTADFSNEDLIAAGSYWGFLKIWDQEGQLIRSLELRNISSASFSSDEKLIMLAGLSDIKIYNLHSGELVTQIAGDTFGWPSLVAFSPQDDKAIIALRSGNSNQNILEIWDIAKKTRLFGIHIAGQAKSIKFSCCETKFLLVYADSHQTDVFSLQNGELLYSLKDSENKITSASFSNADDSIVVAAGNTVKIYDVDQSLKLTLAGHTAKLLAAIYTSNGQHILTASSDKTVKVWDANSGDLLDTLEWPIDDKEIYGRVMFNKNASKIFTGANDGQMKVWLLPTPKKFVKSSRN